MEASIDNFGEIAHDMRLTIEREREKLSERLALMVNMLASRLNITNKWKMFEALWHCNNLRNDYNTALEQKKSLEFQERLKNIFG